MIPLLPTLCAPHVLRRRPAGEATSLGVVSGRRRQRRECGGDGRGRRCLLAFSTRAPGQRGAHKAQLWVLVELRAPAPRVPQAHGRWLAVRIDEGVEVAGRAPGGAARALGSVKLGSLSSRLACWVWTARK